MSDYCDSSLYQQNLYTNTYSLWENSVYYDINNLSPQNFASTWHQSNDEDIETRYTSGPMEAQALESPDEKDRKVVEKTSVNEDPDSFEPDVTENACAIIQPPPTKECSSTHQQSSVVECKQEGPSTCCKGKMVRTTKIQKKFDKTLTKPVKMNKAESMMQKFGWHPGALAKSGSNILGSLASNELYATQKKVYGQNFIKMEKNDSFSNDILKQIYEFVKNNTKIELYFDKGLSKEERRQIEKIVSKLNVDRMSKVEFDSTAQMEMVLQICDVNCYFLYTEIEETDQDSQICVYKEAPEHVFLIIPEDLRDDYSARNSPAELSDSKDEISDHELEEETNPFLKSIIRNMKKAKEKEDQMKVEEKPVEPPKETSVLEKVLDYFVEFTEKRQYSQFKFLGQFTDEESEGIQEFFAKAALYLNNEPCDIREVFENISYEIREDITGNTVINKRPK